MKKENGKRCKKCRSKSIRYEPACKVCMLCGWVKYREKATEDTLWHQDLLNKQYVPLTLLTQIVCAYRSPKHTLGYLKEITPDELRMWDSIQKKSPDSLSKCPHAPQWFIEKELK